MFVLRVSLCIVGENETPSNVVTKCLNKKRSLPNQTGKMILPVSDVAGRIGRDFGNLDQLKECPSYPQGTDRCVKDEVLNACHGWGVDGTDFGGQRTRAWQPAQIWNPLWFLAPAGCARAWFECVCCLIARGCVQKVLL
jgi:hypothetical protein